MQNSHMSSKDFHMVFFGVLDGGSENIWNIGLVKLGCFYDDRYANGYA